jgi:formate hydrogenlyase subunit 3/multisubunit Na+/H+ antiporter MnhD subunit
LLWIAPVPALVASLSVSGSPPLVLDFAPYRVTLELDAPAAMLLGVAALLWLIAGVYASKYMLGSYHIGRFVVCWLLTLTGNVGVFISADLASFYLAFALVPLHIWMPLTYTAAPVPAAAVLSGAVVKAGVIGLIRFLPLEHGLPSLGGGLATLGLLSAFYGVAIGVTQANPKTVLAYSSISQMGIIATVLGMGLTSGDRAVEMPAAFYAANHILTKGALFLVIGVVATAGSARFWADLLPAAVLALGLGGLPLTGGALAKRAVKETLGNGLIGLLATFAAAGGTLLMLHFLRCLRATPVRDASERAPTGLVISWLVMALAAVLVPWVLYFAVAMGNLSGILTPAAFWAALWPILVGGLLWLGLRRWAQFLPDVPEGDIVVVAEAGARASAILGAALERMETFLRRWPVACLSLLIVAIILGALMLWG